MHEDDYMCPNCGAEIASYPNYCNSCKPEMGKEYMKISAQLKHWPEDKPDAGDLCIIYFDKENTSLVVVYYHDKWKALLLDHSYDCSFCPNFICISDLKLEKEIA